MKAFFISVGKKIKEMFVTIGNYFNCRYAGLKTLVAMQLKDKLNFSFAADKKGALTKLIIYILLFAVVTAIIAVLFYLSDLLMMFSSVKAFPISVFNLVFISMLILSIVSCVARFTNTLYFSKDNLVLLSYPVRPNVVFLSKFVVFYIIELIKNILYLIPLLLAYGIIYKFEFSYYPWVIFMFFIITLIPVAIASIVSIPYMLFKMFLVKRPLAQDIFVLLVMIIGTVLLFFLINQIPEDLHFVVKWSSTYSHEFLKFTVSFQNAMLPFYYLSMLVLGATKDNSSPYEITKTVNSQSGIILLVVVGIIIVLILLSYLIAKPLFFKIAAKPFEYNKKVILHNFAVSKKS